MNDMTIMFRTCALFPRPNAEAELLRQALGEWRAHLLKSGRVPREMASGLLVSHGADVLSFEEERTDVTKQMTTYALFG